MAGEAARLTPSRGPAGTSPDGGRGNVAIRVIHVDTHSLLLLPLSPFSSLPPYRRADPPAADLPISVSHRVSAPSTPFACPGIHPRPARLE